MALSSKRIADDSDMTTSIKTDRTRRDRAAAELLRA